MLASSRVPPPIREVVTRLFPGVGALFNPQPQQDIGVGVIEQHRRNYPETGQQPEGVDQRLTGQLVVFRPLLEGDGGGRPHADHGGQPISTMMTG